MAGWRAGLAGIITVASLSACAGSEIPIQQLKLAYGLPASQTFEPSPGMRIHFTDEGNRNGRTLVLVHGFAASVYAWRPWTERLGADYRIVALDLPGHGLTETPPGYQASLDGNAEIVDALAKHLGLTHFIIAGNSMGGAVSLAYAMKHPEKLDGVVLVDAAGWPGEGAVRRGPPGAFALLDNGFGRFLLKLVDPRLVVTSGLKSAYHDESLVTPALAERYAQMAMGAGHRDVLLSQQPQPARAWTPADFAGIRVPTLVMAGEQDAVIPAGNSRAIAAAIPGAYLVTYPNGGHLPMEQLPDETVRHLRTFIGGLPPTRGAS